MLNPMKGIKKTPKVPGLMREIVAANLKRLMDHHMAGNPNKPKTLAGKARLSLSTVQRIVGCKTGATLDNLEALAEAFDLSVYQLLIPDLDVGNPQIVTGAMEAERRAYKAWRKAHPAAEQQEEKQEA